jgi:hypothetical protein
MNQLKDNEIAIDRDKLKTLLANSENQKNEIAALKAEIRELYDGSINILSIIGLADNGMIKKEAFEEGGNALPEILKGASNIMGLVVQAQVPVIGKNAEKKLLEKFGFFSKLLPIFLKYGELFGTQARPEGNRP